MMITFFIFRRPIIVVEGEIRDYPLTHPDFDSKLRIEVGSFGGPDKNQIYGLSNTTAENLWVARSVSTVGSSQSVLSTQSKEFMA